MLSAFRVTITNHIHQDFFEHQTEVALNFCREPVFPAELGHAAVEAVDLRDIVGNGDVHPR